MKTTTVIQKTISSWQVAAASLAFLLLEAVADMAAQTQVTKKVRALLVIDTHASKVGQGCRIAGQNMSGMLRDAFRGRSHMIDIKMLSGTAATPANVTKYYRTLETGPDETLFFYYIGHGAFDTRSKKHYLAMAHGDLFRSEIRSAMVAKRAGLTVILTDCCSSLATASREPMGQGAPSLDVMSPVFETLRHLLLCHRGIVDITAAAPGAYAFGSPDGLFTKALTDLSYSGVAQLDIDRNGFLAWSEFFRHLQHRTNGQYQNLRYAGRTGRVTQATQVPHAFALPGAAAPAPDPPKQFVVTVIENPYAAALTYEYRWGETAPWRSITVKPKHSVPHFVPYRPTGVPWLYVRFDYIGGDNMTTYKYYQVGGYVSNDANRGRNHRFGYTNGRFLDLYRTN